MPAERIEDCWWCGWRGISSGGAEDETGVFTPLFRLRLLTDEFHYRSQKVLDREDMEQPPRTPGRIKMKRTIGALLSIANWRRVLLVVGKAPV